MVSLLRHPPDDVKLTLMENGLDSCVGFDNLI